MPDIRATAEAIVRAATPTGPRFVTYDELRCYGRSAGSRDAVARCLAALPSAAKAVAPVDPEAILKAAVEDVEKGISPSAARARAKKAWEKRHAAGEKAGPEKPKGEKPAAPRASTAGLERPPADPRDADVARMKGEAERLLGEANEIRDLVGHGVKARESVQALIDAIQGFNNARANWGPVANVQPHHDRIMDAHKKAVEAVQEAQRHAGPGKPEAAPAADTGINLRLMRQDVKEFNAKVDPLPAGAPKLEAIHRIARLQRAIDAFATAAAAGDSVMMGEVHGKVVHLAQQAKAAIEEARHHAAQAGKPDDKAARAERVAQAEREYEARGQDLVGMGREAAKRNVPRDHRIFAMIYDAGRLGRDAVAAAYNGDMDKADDLGREADKHKAAAEAALRDFQAPQEGPAHLDPAVQANLAAVHDDVKRLYNDANQLPPDFPERKKVVQALAAAAGAADGLGDAVRAGDESRMEAAHRRAHERIAEARNAINAAQKPEGLHQMEARVEDIRQQARDAERRLKGVAPGHQQGAAKGAIEDLYDILGHFNHMRDAQRWDAVRDAYAKVSQRHAAMANAVGDALAAHAAGAKGKGGVERLARLAPRDQVRTINEDKHKYGFTQHPDLLISAMRETEIAPVGTRVVATEPEVDSAIDAADFGNKGLQERNDKRAIDEKAKLQTEAAERGEREAWRGHYQRMIRMVNSIGDWTKATTRGAAFLRAGMHDAAKLFQHRGALLRAAGERPAGGT